MTAVDVHVRYSKDNVNLDKVATFSLENAVVFKDEIENFRAHVKSVAKFSMITLASPLIALVRLVRSVAFACSGDFNRAHREFIGGFAVPVMAATCLLGSLISSVVYLLDFEEVSLHVQMKRVYAHFEAWVNDIDLYSMNLGGYSQRVSNPADFVGNKNSLHQYVWTTAPCMQPVLERQDSYYGNILNVNRMRKVFPLIDIHDVDIEGNKIVLLSEYKNKDIHVSLCNGTCEHARTAMTYCCFRVETAYDRVLCCEVGQGNCISVADHNDTCGFVFCNAGCIGICCCTEKNNLVAVNTCLTLN